MQKKMFKDELYQYSALGIESDLKDLTLDSIINEYNDMIKNDKITISVVGDFDPDNITTILNKHFTFDDRSTDLELFEQNPSNDISPQEIILKQDVTQAKLAMGYRFDVRYLDTDYYPAIVLNNLLGGTSDAILHQRIREELGLVYFVSSSYDFYKGVLFIFAGINETEYNKTTQEIESIIESIKNGKIEDKYIDIAKKSIINGIIESHDSNYNSVIRLERKDLFNNDIPIEPSIKNINAVTLEDIKKVAQKITLDTTVLLRGEDNE
jgi:predicted Zn-dependent peptidase